MKKIFFLSIKNEFAKMILSGTKQWEFRQNPRFGILPDCELTIGSTLFIVSTFQGRSSKPRIECLCRVKDILRGQSFQQYFSDYDSGHWLDAGCKEGTDRDWSFFTSHILNNYSTAIRLEPHFILPPIECDIVRHNLKKTSWKGNGFMSMTGLKCYSVGEKDTAQYFTEIAHQILRNK